MLNKVKNRLIFFSALTIGVILLVMTCFCLLISERSIRSKNYADFQRNAESLISYLESQSIVTDSWLSEMEYNYHMIISILDGENPLFYGTFHNGDYESLLQKARSIARDQYGINPEFYRSSSRMNFETFQMAGVGKDEYFAAAALVPRNSGYLDAILLSPQFLTGDQILYHRLLFGSGALISWLILSILAGCFIDRMLKPVGENNRRQTYFIASASHELRSPLTVMMSSLSAARIAPKDQQERFFHIMETEGSRMARLIQDMLILAGSDSHSWTIQPNGAELDTLLLEVYDKYQLIAAQKKMPLTLKLPDTEAPLPLCNCDKERISQVLCILIENAFAYGMGETLDLTLILRSKYHEIHVTDHGPGIPDEEKARIFERFYRSDSSHHDRSHFGLGLCIAHEIMVMHKGSLTVADTPGGGATFVIRLPLAVK